MSLALAGLAAAGIVVAAEAPTAPARARVAAAAPCPLDRNAVGNVTVVGLHKLWLNKQEWRSKRAFSLYAKDRLRTAHHGQIDLCLTDGTTSCRVRPGATVRIMPNESDLLDVDRGRADCSKGSSSLLRIRAGKALLEVGDPIFGVSVTKGKTVVRVFLGAVAVRGRAGLAAPVVVGAGKQTVVLHGVTEQPTALAPAGGEKKIFQRLASTLPKPGLKKPGTTGSTALAAIFSRGYLSVALDARASVVSGFTNALLGSLAKAWGLSLRLQTATPADAAPALAKGTIDVFVTASPADVTAAGARLPGAGVAAVPFVWTGKELVQLVTGADAGLATALRRYVAAALLQSAAYATRYRSEFGTSPPYADLGDLAFPTAAHVTGVRTLVHQDFPAVVDGQLGPGLKVTSTAKGTCSEPSGASARVDAWRCRDGGGTLFDPCFSGIPKYVICPTDPPPAANPVNVLKLFLSQPLPAPRQASDPTAGPARRVVTTDGAVCGPAAGATKFFGSQAVGYDCVDDGGKSSGSLAGEAYRASAPWTILTLPVGWQFTQAVADTVGIAEIWFW